MSSSFIEVVKIVEYGPYHVHKPKDAESLKFRVEILRRYKTRRYFVRVYRCETFRLQPAFPQSKGNPSLGLVDAEIFIIDDFLAPDGLEGRSVHEVLSKLDNILEQMFGKNDNT